MAKALSKDVAKANVTINNLNGFNSSVGLTLSGTLPSGATATFSPTSTTSTSVLTIQTAATSPAGSYPLTINGSGGGIRNRGHLDAMNLIVGACASDGRGGGISNSGMLNLSNAQIVDNASRTDAAAEAVAADRVGVEDREGFLFMNVRTVVPGKRSLYQDLRP